MKTPINQKDVEATPVASMENAMVESLTPGTPDAPPTPPAPPQKAPESAPQRQEEQDTPPLPSSEPEPQSTVPSDEGSAQFFKDNTDEGSAQFFKDDTLPPPVYKYHADDRELMGSIRRFYSLGKEVSDEDAFDRMVTDRRWANNGVWNPFFRSAADDLHTALTDTDERKRDLAVMISRFEKMDTNGMESFLGNLGPALLQPENIVSMGAGKVAAFGAKTAMKATVKGILAGAVVDGAMNGIHNHKQQNAQIALKLREHYSPEEVAAATAIGSGASVLPGATFAAVGAYRSQRAFARKTGMLAAKGDPVTVSDVSRETHEAGERLFGRGLSEQDETYFDKLQRGTRINAENEKSPFSTTGLLRDKLVQGTLDKLLPIKRALETAGYAGEAGTATKAFNPAYAFFRMLPRVGQTVEASLTHAVPRRLANGGKAAYVDGDGHSHSLFGSLAPLGEDLHTFLHYTAAKRLVTHPTLQKDFVNADNLVKADIRQIVDEGDLKTGQLTDWDALEEGRWDEVTSVIGDTDHLWSQTHKRLKEYNRGLLEFAADSGLIGKTDVENILSSNEFYAPFYRDMSTTEFETAIGNNAVSTKGNIKSISENWTDNIDNVRSLDRNLIDNTQRLIAAAEQNHAYSNLYRQFKEGDLQDVAELWGFKEVSKDSPKAISAKVPYTRTVTNEAGEETEEHVSKSVYFEFDGSLQAEMMMRALDNTGVVNALRDNAFLRAVTTIPKRVLVAGVTLEPTYVARNLIRDAITAGMFTENQGKEMIPFAAQAVGFHKYSSERTARSVQEASMNGVGMGSMRQAVTADTLSEQAKKYYRNKGANPDNVYKSPLHAMSAVFDKYYVRHINKVENASRLQEYDKALARTGNEVEASMAAANVSTDFTMRGSNAAMTFLNEIFPFFNAALQGIYVSARKLDLTSDRDKAMRRLMVGFGMLGGASIALEEANSDIGVIQQADSVIKDTHWLFPVDKEGVPTYNNDEAVDYIMIPKPYDVGFFANSMEYLLRASKMDAKTGLNYEDNDMKDVMDNLAQYVQSVVLLDPSSPLWNALQGVTNENPKKWNGAPVIPPRLENAPPTMQYTESTPELYRKTGEILNASPLRVQFMAESLLGTAMREVAKGFEHIPGFRDDGLGKRVPNREWTLEQLPVVRAFSLPGKPIPKAVSEYWALQHEMNKSDAAINALRTQGRQMDMDVYLSHHPNFRKMMEASPNVKAMVRHVTKLNTAYRNKLNSQTTPEGVTEVMDNIRGDLNSSIVTMMAELKKNPAIRDMIRRGER